MRLQTCNTQLIRCAGLSSPTQDRLVWHLTTYLCMKVKLKGSQSSWSKQLRNSGVKIPKDLTSKAKWSVSSTSTESRNWWKPQAVKLSMVGILMLKTSTSNRPWFSILKMTPLSCRRRSLDQCYLSRSTRILMMLSNSSMIIPNLLPSTTSVSLTTLTQTS